MPLRVQTLYILYAQYNSFIYFFDDVYSLNCRIVRRTGEPAAGGARLGESTGPELLADRLGGAGGQPSERRWPGSVLRVEHGDPAQEHPGTAQGRGRQRTAAGKANKLRERSVAGLS